MTKPVEKISIKGFKSIRELEDFPLFPLNIFIGANGSGKTNFISVFKLINQIINENLQVFVAQQGGANNLLYFGIKHTETIEFSFSFASNGYNCMLIPAQGDTLFFGNEQVSYHDKSRYNVPYKPSLGSGHKETLLFQESRSHTRMTIADHVIGAMKNWKVYHFHDTSPSAKVKQRGNINDNETFRADAANLAAFLYLLRETNSTHYERIVSVVRLVAPFFDNFNLRPDPLNKEQIQLEWLEKGSDTYFNAHVLSDGTLRFICLAILLLQPNLPTTILIDEPELGLHPYAITVLASLLKSASQKTQVIVSTQSVPLVNQFDPQDIVVVDRVDAQSTFKRLEHIDLEHWLDDYGMGDLWEKNIIGGRPQ